MNVTVPHKNAIADLIDELSEHARLTGAVNTISIDSDGIMQGFNTDGVGLIRDLTENLRIELADRHLLILGGRRRDTRYRAENLLDAQPASLRIANRTVEKADDLAEQFADLGNVSACRYDELDGRQFDLIINATSAGLSGEVPPFPESIINAAVVCYDLSYSMTDTPFCAWARELGAARSAPGLGPCSIEQAAESFLIWRGGSGRTRPSVRAQLP